MIGQTLRIGDRVTITIPQENRDCGYAPCRDGTVAEVVDITEIAYGRRQNYGHGAGIYQNPSWFKVRLPDGTIHTEMADRFSLLDADEQERRRLAWFELGDERLNRVRLRDLPETAFYEGDRVRSDEPGALEYVVVRIDYGYIGRTRVSGDPWPIYSVSETLDGGSYHDVAEQHLALVERGNYWRVEHGEEPIFQDLAEEASFAITMGLSRDLRNPAEGGLYEWSKEQALEAIRSGFAHGLAVGLTLFSGTTTHQVIRFNDEALGQRVRAATIEGFAAKQGGQ